MTGKEKLKLALNHEEGPLLLDIGGMPTTGIHCIVLEQVREYLGLEKRPIKILEPVQMLGILDEDIREALGVETKPCWGAGSMLGFPVKDDYKEWRTPWGQEVLVPKDFVTTTDEKGDTLIYACGDPKYLPAGRMPKTGVFFDNTERTPEFDEDEYRIEDNLEEFGPISQEDLEWLALQRTRYEDSTDVIMGNLGGTAFGDIALVPGPMLREPKGIRDITEWYVSIASRQEILHEIFEYQARYAIENLEKMYAALGDTIQVAYICGTDFGTQKGPFCSNDTFNTIYKPYYQKVNNWIHEHTTWKTFKHCCGSIKDLIPELIDAGFDCLNPVQWTAQNMDRKEIKKLYGDHIVYWGGGINTQKTLPLGTCQEVFDEALECCRIFGKGGGFVFNTIHNIVPGVPPENVVALADAVKKYNQG
jgi:hypothetical protein